MPRFYDTKQAGPIELINQLRKQEDRSRVFAAAVHDDVENWLKEEIERTTGATHVSFRQDDPRKLVPGLMPSWNQEDFGFNPAWSDHGRLWIGRATPGTRARPIAYTAEPYGLETEGFLMLAEFVREHHLEVRIDTRSPHFPSNTVLILLTTRQSH
jgi:hypothetical protein